MAVLLFKLRHVPDDEADEVRALLNSNGIDFYETSAGNWHISMPAIWLSDDTQLEQAKLLLEDYQQKRCALAREQYDELRRNGQLPTVTSRFLENPLRFVFFIGLIALVFYLSLRLFPGF